MQWFGKGLALVVASFVPAGADELTVIDPAAAFPEGPAFVGQDPVYAEYAGNVVSRIDAATGTKQEIWRQDGCGPSAVLPLDVTLLVTCYDNGTLVEISPEGGVETVWDADTDGGALLGPNDLAPDGNGGAWMTASGPWESGPIVGKLYHLQTGGGLSVAADDLHYANGVAVAPDGGRIYVAESEAGRVISFALAEDGTLSDRRLFARLALLDPDSGAGAYPDGMEFAPDGTLWIGQYSSGRILMVAPDGSLAGVVVVPSAAAPNLAFAPDGGQVIVTAVDDTSAPPYPGQVYALELP